ncbi:hypothetical protein BC832DRAFT_8411 [Gaertneriomyces semiglobifer]|nr:hypothetical protein BC832DRAFT_8411 [Gaertneriomyces semiglobifer]
MLKVLAFHPLMCAVPSFSGDLAREAWASHPYFSLSRFVMTLGGGAIIYLWMGGVADLGYALLETVVNVRVRDMFAAPWEATSIRSFWKWRWNATFQEGLECAIVPGEPVRTEEVDHKKHDGEPKHHDKQKKMSFMQTMFSAFLIFLLSGFFHDAVNYATWGYLSPTTTIFFFLQFLAVAIEFPVSKMMIYRLTPKYIKIVAVLLWLAVSGGLFVAPYMQHGGLAVFASPLGECGNIYEKASNAFGKHTAVAV